MFGAIIGDIIGSRFEWNNIKTKKFELLNDDCFVTDDSIMTIAVAETFASFNDEIEDELFKERLIDNMKRIGRNYPHCGFGGHFYEWIMTDDRQAYGSYGNGSAMRVSPAGFYASSLDEAEKFGRLTAEVTHNHPEGIKAAKVVAGCIYLARIKKNKKDIYEYISKYYLLDKRVKDIRKKYKFDVSCQGSVPQALTCFLEADNFEDCMRNCVSIGGDSDTICAIAGGIAEAYFGIPQDISLKATNYLDDYLSTSFINSSNKFKEHELKHPLNVSDINI